MSPIQEATILRRNPAVSGRWRRDGELLTLYNSDTGLEKALNATGVAVWRAMNGALTIGDIAAEVAARFDAASPADVANDVREFGEGLLKGGLAIELEASLAAPDPAEQYALETDAPKQMDICLTGKCNLKCRYCFYANEMAGRADLPKEEWFEFFKELKSLGVRSLTLSGGEVFVRPDLWELIDAIIDARMRFNFLSNGTLVTEKALSELEQGHRRARLDSIQVSIDGSCAAVHDASRGNGSFDRAIRAMRMLKGAGIRVACRVTINRHNVDDLENVARLLLEDVGLGGFGTNDAMPMGAGCHNQGDIALTPRQQILAMRIVEKLEARYDGRISATAGPLSKVKGYRDMERARLTGEKAKRWRMGFLTACGGVFNKLAVNHDGVITPCNMLPKIELGRINRDTIKDIWLAHPTLKALRDRRGIPMSEVPGCSDCEWKEFCNGSCPGLACEMTGEFNAGNPHDCYRNFLKTISEEDRYEMFIKPVMGEMRNAERGTRSMEEDK